MTFYSPMFLLYSVHDASEDAAAALSILDDLMEDAREKLIQSISGHEVIT